MIWCLGIMWHCGTDILALFHWCENRAQLRIVWINWIDLFSSLKLLAFIASRFLRLNAFSLAFVNYLIEKWPQAFAFFVKDKSADLDRKSEIWSVSFFMLFCSVTKNVSVFNFKMNLARLLFAAELFSFFVFGLWYLVLCMHYALKGPVNRVNHPNFTYLHR